MKDIEKEVLEQSQLKDKDLEQVVGGNEENGNLGVERDVNLEVSRAVSEEVWASDEVERDVNLEVSRAPFTQTH